MSYETEDKMVSHPDHYQSGKFEVIDIIDEFTKHLWGTEAVCTANALKYILRWKKKNGIQDVKKAIWYLTHLVEHLENKEREEHAEFDEYRLNKLTMPVDASRSSEGINKEVHSCDDCAFMKCDPWVEPCHSCDLHLDPPSKWLAEDKAEGKTENQKLEPGCDKCEISECRFLKDPFMNPPYDQLWKDHEQLKKKYGYMQDYAQNMENNYCEAEQEIEEREAVELKLRDICRRLTDDNKDLEDENLQLKADYQNLEDETKKKLVALTKENCQLREKLIDDLIEDQEPECWARDICGNCKHFNPDQGRCTFDMHFPEKDYWDGACKYFFVKPDAKVVIKQEETK